MDDNDDHAFGQLGDLLGAFDDDDYDNIMEDEDARQSRGERPLAMAKSGRQKERKAQQLPDKFALIYQRGVELYLNQKYEEALEIFLELTHGVKNYAPLYNQMADSFQSLGRNEEAFECCKKAVNIDVGYLEAWARYVDLAELLDSEELVFGLKKYIRLNLEKGETSVLGSVRRLIELLEADKSSSCIKFKKLLFHLQYKAGNREECFLLGESIARSCLAIHKVDAAIGCLAPIISSALETHETPPQDVILVYLECLLEKKRHEEVFQVLHGFDTIQLTGPSEETFRVDTVLSVDMSEDLSLPLVTACCIVMIEFDNYASVEALVRDRILAADRFPESPLFLMLADSLLEKKQDASAEAILDRLYLQTENHTAEFYFRLGKMHESRENFKQALDAYNRAVSLKPSFREARWHIRKLGLPVPKVENIGTVEERQQTILIQRSFYAEYLVAVDQGDDAEALRLAADLVSMTRLVDYLKMASSTFAHLAKVDYKDLIYNLWNPQRLESPLQDLLLYAPSIATNDVPLEEFWQVILQGCGLAFQARNFDDLLDLACSGLRTADFKPFPEKARVLQRAVLVAAFYSRQFRFSCRYLRDGLTTTGKADLPVVDWNFFYQLVADGGAGQQLTKWAYRWLDIHGYSREITMISATDSMRRGNYRHAFELFHVILKKEGLDKVDWYILLSVGILYVNLASATHCGARIKLYTMGMVFLEKYGARRGVCPEVLYNKARAAHQFGDLSEAMRFYEECVALSDRTVFLCSDEKERVMLDFKLPALFNLKALYIRNGIFLQVKQLYRSRLSWKTIRSLRTTV